MKTKKFLSVALAILMLIGTFAVGASALDSDEITETDFYVAGTHISEGYYLVADGGITNENASASNYNVKFAPATANANARLTFNNAKNLSKLIEIDNGTALVAAGGKLDVELIGENSFIGGYAAFYCADDINFIGDGSISYTTKQEDNVSFFVASAYDITVGDKAQINVSIPDNIITVAFLTLEGSVIIKDNAKVNIKNTGVGIMSPGLTVSDNAEVTVNCGRRYGGAIEVINGDVSISGNAVVNVSTTRDAGYDVSDDTIYALSIENGNLSVSDNAKLNANAGAGYQSYGIYMESDDKDISLTVSDQAFVKGVTGKSENCSAGVYCGGNIAVCGESKLEGRGGSFASFDDGNGSDKCFGVYAEKLLKTEYYGYVYAVGGMADSLSCGVTAENIEIGGINGISAKAYNVSNGTSAGIISRNNLEMSEHSYINSYAGKSSNGYSEGIKTVNLTLKDGAYIMATGDLAENSIGIHVEKNAVLSGDVIIDAGSCDATTASVGFFSENFKATDSVCVTADSNDANQTFAFDVKTADISGSVEIRGESGSGDGSSIGVFLNDSTTIGENCIITGNAASSSKDSPMTAGVYSEGVLTVAGNASVSGESVFHYGIAAKELAVSENAILEAEGGKQAIYCQKFALNGHENSKITVVRSDISEQKIDWDGSSPLGSLDSFYSYVSISQAEPEPELNFFEQIIASIVEFFNKIALFFSSIFSFGK